MRQRLQAECGTAGLDIEQPRHHSLNQYERER